MSKGLFKGHLSNFTFGQIYSKNLNTCTLSLCRNMHINCNFQLQNKKYETTNLALGSVFKPEIWLVCVTGNFWLL